MDENKTKRAAIILEKIFDSNSVSISEVNNVLHIGDGPQGVKVTNFLYNLQQPTKKIDVPKYFKIFSELDKSSHLVCKTHAKKFWMSFTAKRRKKNNRLKNKENNSSKNNEEEDLGQKKKTQNRKLMGAKRRQIKRRVEQTGISTDDVKKLDNL